MVTWNTDHNLQGHAKEKVLTELRQQWLTDKVEHFFVRRLLQKQTNFLEISHKLNNSFCMILNRHLQPYRTQNWVAHFFQKKSIIILSRGG